MGAIKQIVGGSIARKSAKKANLAIQDSLNKAITKQDDAFEGIKLNQEGIRDDNIYDIEGLRDQNIAEYESAFDDYEALLQKQFDEVGAAQQLGFDNREGRLISSIDDAINRSEQSFQYAQDKLMPYIAAGRQAFDTYVNEAGEFEFDYQKSPAYDFIKSEALGAATNTAAASGMGLSGATQKALADRASNLAATDYENQYRRARGEYDDRMDRNLQLGNIALAGDQSLMNLNSQNNSTITGLQMGLADALANNDMARAASASENILRLTNGQGQIGLQAAQTLSGIRNASVDAVNSQRAAAGGNIDNARSANANSVSGLLQSKGASEANYQRERGKALTDMWSGGIDLGMMGAAGLAGGAGAFGGAGGFSGAMQGMQLGGQLSNMGGGQGLSQGAQNFMQSGSWGMPQQQSAPIQIQSTPSTYSSAGYNPAGSMNWGGSAAPQAFGFGMGGAWGK